MTAPGEEALEEVSVKGVVGGEDQLGRGPLVNGFENLFVPRTEPIGMVADHHENSIGKMFGQIAKQRIAAPRVAFVQSVEYQDYLSAVDQLQFADERAESTRASVPRTSHVEVFDDRRVESLEAFPSRAGADPKAFVQLF